MSKKSIIIRSIIAGIMVLISVISIILLVETITDILNTQLIETDNFSDGLSKGIAIGAGQFVLLFAFLCGIPFVLATLIYQLVLIIKKKFWIVDFIPSVLLILSWASLYIVPAIFF